MEQLAVLVPYSFIRQRTRLSWRDVKFGIEEGILQPKDAIDVAMDVMEHGAETEQVLALASSSPEDSLLGLVSQIAEQEKPPDLSIMRRKWAFLLLAWLYEHRARFSDPLDMVGKLYADLDYPEQVAPFVRYMPTDEPDLGSKDLNEQRLFQKWADYLQKEARYFLLSQV